MTAHDKPPRRRPALDGVRIVEFGHRLAGPLTTMLLADQGAEVIKVERPRGDPARSAPVFAYWNRGKQSVICDLKTSKGRADAMDLVAGADVVVQNLRPASVRRLGLDAKSLMGVKSDLIYCSITGFGTSHPLSGVDGWEELVAAQTGLYQPVDITSSALFAGSAPTAPQFTPVPVAGVFAAMHSAGCIAAALLGRKRGQPGQNIEVPLYRAMHTAAGRVLVSFESYQVDETFTWPRLVMARLYQCADDRWIQLHGMWPRFLQQTLAAMDRMEWYDDAVALFGRDVERYVVDAWIERFEARFRDRPAADWEQRISRHGGACTLVRTLDEWRTEPHAVVGGVVVTVDNPGYGAVCQPGLQVHLSKSPGRADRVAPQLGEHSGPDQRPEPPSSATTDSVTSPMRRTTPPLDGVRVLDLCVVLAGPSAGRTLAELGADVIKVEDPHHIGDPAGNLDVNRGKRSIIVDLKSDAGKQILWDLIDTADVILENNRAGSLDKLGFGYEAVSERRPEIVYGSMNCHGYRGEWSGLPGWEQSAQAATGIQARQGGYGSRPRLLHYPIDDYGTGLMGAFGVILALFERVRSGDGQHVDTGLSLTATMMQSALLANDSERATPLDGRDAIGWSAASRMYRTQDGWVYLHCADTQQFQSLGELLELVLPEISTSARGDAAIRIERLLVQRPSAYWLDKLTSAGIAAVPVAALAGTEPDEYALKTGLRVRRPHPSRGSASHVGSVPLVKPAKLRLGRPSPVQGADSEEVLAELGYSPVEIASLIRDQVVQTPVG